MEKIIKIKKDRKCSCCGKQRLKGDVMFYYEGKHPKFDDDDKQIGIQYYKDWYCYDPLSEYMPPCG
jgi:hypothetical protein